MGWGGRIGLGFTTDDNYDPYGYYYNQSSVVTVPLQVNYIFGKDNNPHTFEVGAGVTITGKKSTSLTTTTAVQAIFLVQPPSCIEGNRLTEDSAGELVSLPSLRMDIFSLPELLVWDIIFKM